jgi:ribosome biogenesis GTPase
VLDKIGYRPEMARWAAARDAALGRVTWVDGGVLTVLSERGPLRCTYGGRLLAAVAANRTHASCAGDWCVIREWPGHRLTVEQLLPRSTAVTTSDPAQLLCTNADLVAVVLGCRTGPAPAVAHRLLRLARDSGARPLVVLTMSDLGCYAAEELVAASPDVEVVRTSTVTGAGLPRLRELVDQRLTLALLGTSGQGKSSLTTALVGADVLPSRDKRAVQHGAVRRELVPLPSGGAVIDTPGLSGLALFGGLRQASGGRA